VALAFAAPEPGARGGALAPELTNKLGVALIFFLHGAGLSLAAMLEGTRRYRVHLLVQLTTFGLFPLVGFALSPLVARFYGPGLALGFFFLCALPSTVSSSVAMTALARGNVAAAVFNATLSSLLGVVLTPFWVGLYLSRTGITLPFGDVVLDLLRWLVLPLALGQVSRPVLKRFLERHRAAVSVVDRATILLLVYTSFCDSVKGGVFSQNGLASSFVVLCLDTALLSAALGLLSWLARPLRLSHGDRSAAVFCGSKKTLAGGVPMAKVMFGNGPSLGLILLPILLYHSIQLVIVAWLAARWARGAETPDRGP
jgi:sodium/bile acid cotransporter 7